MSEKRRLIDEVNKQEKEEQKNEAKVKATMSRHAKTTVSKIISKEGAKDKQISAKVNQNIYDAFTNINKLQGISNNSALNMLITKYVRENREIIDEDNNIFQQ